MPSSTMNISERTKEIGTLLSLGFPRQYVVKLFVKEMVILTTACVVVGLILATIIATIVNSLNFKFRPPGVQGEIQFLLSQTWELSLIMSAILAVVSIVSCWYVTRHMTRKKIIDLLQTTGA
ncbi:MAG: FtsX-like permease family protein [Bdellovibrionota bacterium]